MRTLRGRVVEGLAVAGLSACVVVLAGCQGGKLSAGGAAQKLLDYLSPGYGVQCVPISDKYWSDMCQVTPPRSSKGKPYRVKVKVGPNQIVDRVYCGKQGPLLSAATLAATRC